jgi:UTP-glucose-1-phosphate uridylyltransferase
MLPDELMGDSSLLAHMNGVCVSSGGSVVALKRVPQDAVGAYGVIEPLSPVDPDGVVAIRGMVEKPEPADAPSDLIIIGRYVLTPDVFDEIATLRPGAIGEIQLTDALRAQATRSPFHGVISEIERFDTGTPLGYIQAAIAMMMRRPEFGAELAGFVAELGQRAPAGRG